MRKELEKLTTKQLIELVKTFEHYPAVTLKDGKDYILSYLEDEACAISKKEIAEYLLNNNVEITDDNIHLYYSYMNDNQLKENKVKLTFIFNSRSIVLKQSLFLNDSDKNWLFFEKTNFNGYILSQSFFSIKDTLTPLADYIKEIKNSENYKENYLKPLMIDCLKNGVVITKDNIHLYYEFMNKDDLFKNQTLINNTLRQRYNEYIENNIGMIDYPNLISYYINFDSEIIPLLKEGWGNTMIVINEIFGIKDTLKPIEEFISEIKECAAYKSYVAYSAKVS
jgi:hypothetical protein